MGTRTDCLKMGVISHTHTTTHTHTHTPHTHTHTHTHSHTSLSEEVVNAISIHSFKDSQPIFKLWVEEEEIV
ncbi:hypothetical protein SK128_028118 [Halocaridina rubra]|uniref:Uncharacterized protein n=1 Tax=Halocaridina rubra TaxID=373956 RepID=A0AAN8X409_HALRR